MTDRPTASTITDTQLDDLYDLLEYLTGCLASTYELTSGEVLTAAREAIAADRERAARSKQR